MTLRVLLVALLVAALVALIGRGRRRVTRRPGSRAVEAAEKCPRCGSYMVAGTPCACGDA